MKWDTAAFPTSAQLISKAVDYVAVEIRLALAERGRFRWAVSGGKTPWPMFAGLADAEVDWEHVHIFQVDERVAPAGDSDRNWTHLKAMLLDKISIPASSLHPMPVEANNLEEGAAEYQRTLEAICGKPAVFDMIHLGLGPDGHTASLVPNDPVLQVTDRDVALTGQYQGRRRMTLTYPILNRARKLFWLVEGADKAEAIYHLREQDGEVPAARVANGSNVVFADTPAWQKVSASNAVTR